MLGSELRSLANLRTVLTAPNDSISRQNSLRSLFRTALLLPSDVLRRR